MILTFLLISVFIFFPFNSLTFREKNFTPSDFHQEVVLIQYFYPHQEFMFLCVRLSIFLSFIFWGWGCVGGCFDYVRTNEQISTKNFM